MSCMAGLCGLPTGGTPWHAPHTAAPRVVQTGCDGPWQNTVQVPVVRSQPTALSTSAGAALSRCPGDVVNAGTT